MTRFNNLAGQKIGRLLVLNRTNKSGSSIWLCKCDCGKIVTVKHGSLQSNHTKSCGCLQVDIARKLATKHGLHKTRTYNIWNGILTRCKNPNHPSYAYYGAVGITVCDRWLSFKNFIEDMGECPDNQSIDRTDNLKGYEPNNCQWVEQHLQNRNQRSNVLLTLDGKTMCQADWAKETGMKRETIARRINLGWEMEKILTCPVRRRHNTFPSVKVKPEDALHGPVITFKSSLENIITKNRLYRSTLDDPSSWGATQSLLLKPSKKR